MSAGGGIVLEDDGSHYGFDDSFGFSEDSKAGIQIGSQVIVRESQTAIFFRDGKALDSFGPGRHTIATANVPLIKDLLGKAIDLNL